jgi:hypothetical protein
MIIVCVHWYGQSSEQLHRLDFPCVASLPLWVVSPAEAIRTQRTWSSLCPRWDFGVKSRVVIWYTCCYFLEGGCGPEGYICLIDLCLLLPWYATTTLHTLHSLNIESLHVGYLYSLYFCFGCFCWELTKGLPASRVDMYWCHRCWRVVLQSPRMVELNLDVCSLLELA